MSYTFSIIKPDSISKGHQMAILRRIKNSNFNVNGLKHIHLTKEQAEEFYSIHKDKPFFKDLIKFMTSGPVIVLSIHSQGNTVEDFRELIGDTDPNESELGTIRNLYGTDVAHNAIHGADSDENAKKETLFFFPELSSIF
jgi:nucleoside-diphosphate kinase